VYCIQSTSVYPVICPVLPIYGVSLFTEFVIINGPESWKALMKFLHVKSLHYVVTVIALHVGRVVIADRGEDNGIISKMLSCGNVDG